MRNWRKSNEQDWLFAALWPHWGKYRFAWLYCLFLFWTLQVIMVYFSQVTCHLYVLPWFFLLIRTKKRITVHTVATSASREMQWSVKQMWNVSPGLHLHSQWERWEHGAEALTLHINTIQLISFLWEVQKIRGVLGQAWNLFGLLSLMTWIASS